MTRRAATVAAIVVAAIVGAGVLVATLGGDDAGAPSSEGTRALALVANADGRTVAAIERLERGRWRAALARARADGTLDTDYGDPLPLEHPVAIARQDDGKLLVAGERVVRGRRSLAVTRVDATGRIDRAFG